MNVTLDLCDCGIFHADLEEVVSPTGRAWRLRLEGSECVPVPSIVIYLDATQLDVLRRLMQGDE